MRTLSLLQDRRRFSNCPFRDARGDAVGEDDRRITTEALEGDGRVGNGSAFVPTPSTRISMHAHGGDRRPIPPKGDCWAADRQSVPPSW
jgi:hypothetical protein